jgi:hypothetical protein
LKPWEAERFTYREARLFLEGKNAAREHEANLFDLLAIRFINIFSGEAARDLKASIDILNEKQKRGLD